MDWLVNLHYGEVRRMTSHFRRLLAAIAVLALLPAWSAAQGGATINGTVRAEGGIPLPNVSVFLQGTNLGTMTKGDGAYSIVVPAARVTGQAATLTARLIGYKVSSVQITLSAGTITQDFSLSAVATQLEAVVTTALSVSRQKATIGTSQQQVGGQELTKTQNPNLVSALSGKVSGVTITNGGTQGGSSRIVIRGPSSLLGNNQPLFIVDGIPVSNDNLTTTDQATGYGGIDYGNSIQDLNADDIASVSVLKGPNAAALYGSRAANGAVVITTKSGSAAARGVSVTASNYTTFDKPSILPDYQNLYGQGAGGQFQYVNGAGLGVQDGNDQSFGPRLDGQPRDQFTGPGMPWSPHPDNVESFFNTGITMVNNLSFTANGERANARISGTDEQIKGVVPNNFLRKQAASLSGGVTFNDRLKANGSIQFTKNGGMNRPGTGYNVGIMEQFIWFGRQVDMNALRNYYDADGELFNWNYNFHNNPFWLQYENPERDNRNRVIGSASLTYEFAPWLTGMVRGGTDTYSQSRNQGFGKGNLNYADPNYFGAFNFQNRTETETNTEAILTATHSFADKFDINANVGGNIRRNKFSYDQISTSGISAPGIYNVANAAISPTLTNGMEQKGVNSLYGSAALTYDKFWTVEVTGRNDWSSTLPEKNNSYFYPSVNSSLVISELFPSLQGGVLSYLKVRGGWARVGNDADPYQLATVYNGQPTQFGSHPQFTLGNSIANSVLKPEQTTGVEGGIEFGLLDDRLTFDVTYYTQSTEDQIIPVSLSPTTGFSSMVVNAGKMTNKGVEALVSAVPIKLANGFEWRTSFNFTKNTNKVESLYPQLELKTLVLGSYWSANVEAKEGEPYGVIIGAPYMRDEATGKLITRNGKPRADNANRRVLGNYNPDWVGGWNNDFRYKAASLSFLIDIRHGGDIFSVSNMFGNYTGVFANTIKGREDDWDSPGVVVDGIDQNTGLPNDTRVTAEDYYQSLYGIHEAFVYDASFVKLREVRLGFELPTSWTQNVRLSKVNLALVGRNLLTHADIPNIDPEVALSTRNLQGFEFAALPTARSIGFNISVTP